MKKILLLLSIVTLLSCTEKEGTEMKENESVNIKNVDYVPLQASLDEKKIRL